MRTYTIAIFAAVFLSGYPQTWHLTIVDDMTHPIVCVSSRRNCAGNPIALADFVVAAVDDDGRYANESSVIEPMWIIESAENVPLGTFTYGIPPSGWVEVQQSKPLAEGKWYVAGQHYIRFTRSENGVHSEVLGHKEFGAKLIVADAPAGR